MSRSFVLVLVAGVAGCSGATGYRGPGGTGGMTFSCDSVFAGMHNCTDYAWSGTGVSSTMWSQACTQAGGTAGTGCDAKGAVGGCAIVSMSGGVSITTTTWYYSGSVDAVKRVCAAEGASFVSTGAGRGDGGANGDMAVGFGFALDSGVYVVDGDVTLMADACAVGPNDPQTRVAGTIYALVNDGMGNIKLGNPSDAANPNNPQQYGTQPGTPPQPPLGESCPGVNNPSQCSTEPGARPFMGNTGTLVRDNNGSAGNCRLHRHAVNEVTLTADNTFTAVYTRTDTQHAGCTINFDCTSAWTWHFKYVKPFGQ